MHRIDTPTAVGGLFTEGNQQFGIPPTVVSDDWANAVQEEVSGYIESRSIVLNKADNTQLRTAIEGHVRSEINAGFRNLVHNGVFRFWERVDQASTPFTMPTTDIDISDVSFVDRWYCTAGGGGAGTIARNVFTSGQTDVPLNPSHYLTFIQTSNATTSDPALITSIEGVATHAAESVTVSFQARVSSGTLDIDIDFLQDFGPGGSSDVASSSVTRTVNTTWNKLQATIPLGSMTGLTIAAQHSRLALRLRLPQGSTFTLDITQVQVEPGSGASDFEVRTEGDELRLLQRYYEKIGPGAGLPADHASSPRFYGMTNSNGGGENSVAPIIGLLFKVEKRTEGTGSGGAFLVLYENGGTNALDVIAGAGSSTGGIDNIVITAHGAESGQWTANFPAAGLYAFGASWACDVEFGTE